MSVDKATERFVAGIERGGFRDRFPAPSRLDAEGRQRTCRRCSTTGSFARRPAGTSDVFGIQEEAEIAGAPPSPSMRARSAFCRISSSGNPHISQIATPLEHDRHPAIDDGQRHQRSWPALCVPGSKPNSDSSGKEMPTPSAQRQLGRQAPRREILRRSAVRMILPYPRR